jgi:hypothetical protein
MVFASATPGCESDAARNERERQAKAAQIVWERESAEFWGKVWRAGMVISVVVGAIGGAIVGARSGWKQKLDE